LETITRKNAGPGHVPKSRGAQSLPPSSAPRPPFPDAVARPGYLAENLACRTRFGKPKWPASGTPRDRRLSSGHEYRVPDESSDGSATANRVFLTLQREFAIRP